MPYPPEVSLSLSLSLSPSRTKWTRRVPHPVLIGHAASLTLMPYPPEVSPAPPPHRPCETRPQRCDSTWLGRVGCRSGSAPSGAARPRRGSGRAVSARARERAGALPVAGDGRPLLARTAGESLYQPICARGSSAPPSPRRARAGPRAAGRGRGMHCLPARMRLCAQVRARRGACAPCRPRCRLCDCLPDHTAPALPCSGCSTDTASSARPRASRSFSRCSSRGRAGGG